MNFISVLLVLFLVFVFCPVTTVQSSPPPLTLPDSDGALASLHSEVALVATLNGSIYAVDVNTGALRWEVSVGGQMVRSSMSSQDAGQPVFVPSVNGDLFVYGPNHKMRRLPFSAQDLVDAAPFATNDGMVFLGSKHTHVYSLDPSTGQMKRWYSEEKSDGYGECDEELPPRGSLLIGRTEYNVKVLDAATGLAKWNVSVAEFHTAMSPSERGLPGSGSSVSVDRRGLNVPVTQSLSVSESPGRSSSPSGRFSFHRGAGGEVVCVDAVSGDPLWKNRFESQMVSVHMLPDDQSAPHEYLQPFRLDQSSQSAHQTGDAVSVYVGAYDGQLLATSTAISIPPQQEHDDTHGVALAHYSDAEGLLGVHHIDVENWGHSQDIRQLPSHVGGLGVGNFNASLTANTSSQWFSRSGGGATQFVLTDTVVGIAVAGFLGFTGMLVFLVFNTNRRLLVHRREAAAAGIKTATDTGQLSSELEPRTEDGSIDSSVASDTDPSDEVADDDGGDGGDMDVVLSKFGLGGGGEEASHAPVAAPANGASLSNIGKLRVSSKILGYGSQGTIVFEGQLEDGRVVAVKRMLTEFYQVANKEVELLLESDEQSNIIRYYAKEQTDEFIFLALELCEKTLGDVLERTSEKVTSSSGSEKGGSTSAAGRQGGIKNPSWTPKVLGTASLNSPISLSDGRRYCRELLTGLSHLHDLNIVHRDLKPRNVLLTKRNILKISDMGLARKLEGHRESFSTLGAAAGSFGWLAPEVLHGGRMTKAVDVFSAGCLIYSILTGGDHPFGGQYEREMRIMAGEPANTERLVGVPEARDLVETMVRTDAEERLTVQESLKHPFFWSAAKQLQFLNDASDRLECEKPTHPIVAQLESHAHSVLGGDWQSALHPDLIGNLGKYRKYNFQAIRDLLRVVRNKKNHFRDLPLHVQQLVGQPPDGFVQYFRLRFPLLLLETYKHLRRHCMGDAVFQEYF